LGVLEPSALYRVVLHHVRMTERFEYKVFELREKLIGGKMSGAKLESLLNEQAAQGWRLKAITTAEIKGRIGPGGVEGILITFERPTAP
jgi:Domain of unknown function (DUF4177)